MNAVAAALSQGAGDFLQWWLGELRGLLPGCLTRALRPAERIVRIEDAPAGLVLRRVENGAAETVVTVGSGDELARQRRELAAVLESCPPSRWRYGLYLPEGKFLRDTIRLPAAAAENLREVVRFQLDRQTPFRRDEIFYDCRLAAAAGATADVEILVSRRDIVNEAVARARALDLPVHFVTAGATAERPFNLLPPERGRKQPNGRRLNALLAVLALLLGATAIWLPIERDRRTAEILALRVDTLRKEAQSAERLTAELDASARRLGFVTERKHDAPPLIRVLDNMTRLLPDAAWVSRFTYNEGTVRIVVHAPESAAIVRLIEGSGAFADARMVTAVRQDERGDREQFSLSFSVRAPDKAGEPPAAFRAEGGG